MTDLELALERAHEVLAIPRRGHVSDILRDLVDAIEAEMKK